jgi:hypothetical protein
MEVCKWCEKEFERPFPQGTGLLDPHGDCCTKRCYNAKLKDSQKTPSQCSECGSPIVLHPGRKTTLCLRCAGIKIQSGIDQKGENNPNWKGGHRCWWPGRYGKDKDGLSWHKQRALCVERDDNECQDPDCETEGLRICVHHKVPYRISFSHALDNLICLCDPCHGKWEAEVQEHWGGTVLQEVIRRTRLANPPIQYPTCPRHGLKYKTATCKFCDIESRNFEIIQDRISSGLSFPKLAAKYGFKTHVSIVFMMQDYRGWKI